MAINSEQIYTQIVEYPYFSGIKREKLLIHSITWMNLKIVMLSERSQAKKSTEYMNPLI